ncbi:hypothetical protein [Hoeflea sp.]|uniref:hypothetical protein n=1 Tax=Hoeflea sp. TaxID=1940281 RepID=UPI003B51AF95
MKKAASRDRAGALTRYVDEPRNRRHRKKLQLPVSLDTMVERLNLGGSAGVPNELAEKAGVSVTSRGASGRVVTFLTAIRRSPMPGRHCIGRAVSQSHE